MGAVSKHALTNRELSEKVSNAGQIGLNENPGATAIATGAKDVIEAAKLPFDLTPKPHRSAMSLYAKSEHKRAVKMLGYALTLDTSDAWIGTAAVWQARLSERERAALAFSALKALDRATALATCQAALGGAGNPGVPFMSDLQEAANWADCASPEELSAYCLACFNRMAPATQAAFVAHIEGRVA